MDSEEAVLQMNMLGHDFFIFNDRETEGTSIVYRRNDGKYGLIETNGREIHGILEKPQSARWGWNPILFRSWAG